MKREKEMSMADLWVMEINGRMEQVKKLYTMAGLWSRGLKHVIYVLWNIPWERKLFTSENIQGKGVGFSCVGNVVED
jgi:hypothetical protein